MHIFGGNGMYGGDNRQACFENNCVGVKEKYHSSAFYLMILYLAKKYTKIPIELLIAMNIFMLLIYTVYKASECQKCLRIFKIEFKAFPLCSI